MALNHASHNPTGEKTGPATGPPPPVSSETAAAVAESAKQDPVGQQAPGKDGEVKEGEKPKTAKQLEKERQKAEKAKKFAEKEAKKQALAAATTKNATKKKTAAKEEIKPYVEETPKGEKKILKSLDDEYHKAYIPSVVESAWYDWWEKQGYFEPEFGPDGNVKPAGYFVISEPPPNVTGALHCGHALANALQDTMIRWNRMKGLTTLYLPGCDHAGISTQSVVEKMLWRREKKTRHDLGRQAMVERIWEWKGEYHQRINNVLRRMGGSFDWSREAFTMDENLSKAVTETFVRLHEEGLIYRSDRLVNWCTTLRTALSNLEVDNKDIEGRTLLDVPGYERKVEFGVITHFKYPIEGSEETIEVATTRPETMLGDSGIAVHPDDKRYKHLVGKKAKHPFVDRLMPIVADTYVDPEFGTGAVKITPAHDPNDFALGQRHKLEFINILTDDGLLNQNGGQFAGQKRFDVRYSVVDELTKLGLFVKKENNPMRIPLCQRTKDVIEPIVKPQWWMRMKSLAEPAIEAVRNGDIKIRPATAEADYFRWLENIQDWCLSRQLWWGHQAPAYFVEIEGENNSDSDDQYWIVGRTDEEAQEKAAKKFPGKKFTLRRDEDVLDTWFSSGLWPFSTLGWPNETPDMAKLYPTSVLETGWDILFFWVARMIIFGLKLTGNVPFREVYCHSLIRDSEGRKMSKSLGNVIDPVDIMEGIQLNQLHEKLLEGNLDPKELKTATKYQQTAFPQGIPECGADALRFSLVSYTTGGGDINFDVKVMHAFRRFCNKVYQATKYVLGKIDADYVPPATADKTGKETLAERWILHKLSIASRDVNKALEDREFAKSTQIAYHYFHDDLCDVFIEYTKPIIQDGTPEARRSAIDTLYTALEGGLTMLHPYMPFLTEELWQRLARRPGDKTETIMRAAYPQYRPDWDDAASEASYEMILDAAAAARSLAAQHGVKNAKAAVKLHKGDDKEAAGSIISVQWLSGKAISEVKLLAEGDAEPAEGWASNTSEKGSKVFVEVPARPLSEEKKVQELEKKLEQTKV
ncbi:Aminoacyl-tRNA synthetase class I conserved site [Lasiodiplodia theobromae]|uniref:valine--tRNA ligase n=1 Tax=Lasiodiplodia theobromae TaxID=45133 RepID=A0A5N5D9F6_9PEZI|nr:Valyl-tRNA synthetase [Lasiodiplodia theobromae]KAB2574020.1 Valine--tRNA ligase [Lasiodiplodia theobromae]KAF4536563.1 Valyl-tRNA synthetase [Lasiodiplodia theobromae]KAF9633698.1 Aminoacyl-tRNA synthetase class I conserved site [Lasiodiplodia theobromae]